MNAYRLVFISIIVLLLSSCESHVESSINEAYEAFNDNMPRHAETLIESLLKEDTDDMSDYDRAYLAIAAMHIGVERDNIPMLRQGLGMAAEALRRDAPTCNDVFELEGYSDTFDGTGINSYAQFTTAALSQLQDLELAQNAVGSWTTDANQRYGTERHNCHETLILKPKGVLTDLITVHVSGTDGSFDYKFTGHTQIDGKWSIEDGMISLWFDLSTLQTDIDSNDFKAQTSASAFFSGRDIFADAFSYAMNENNIINEVRENFNDQNADKYRSLNGPGGFAIEIDGNSMTLTGSDMAIHYKKTDDK